MRRLADADLVVGDVRRLLATAPARHAHVSTERPSSVFLPSSFTRVKNAAIAVIVVLREPFQRVIVALRALDARAEERMGGRLGHVLRLAVDEVVAARRVVTRAAPSPSARRARIRPTAGSRPRACANPAGEPADALLAPLVLVALDPVLEQLAPVRGPGIDILGALQEPIHERRPLLRGRRP